MSDEVVISVEGLGKKYRLGAGRANERYTALRDVIAEKARSLFRNPQSAVRNGSEADASEFWAAVPELGGRFLRVVTLEDRLTIHNAFPDRRFRP